MDHTAQKHPRAGLKSIAAVFNMAAAAALKVPSAAAVYVAAKPVTGKVEYVFRGS